MVPGEAGVMDWQGKGVIYWPKKLEHGHIPVTLGVWPHGWCSVCPSALGWATQTASFRASSCGSFSCSSKAAEALLAHPSHALSPSALSDPGQWGGSGQWAVLVGSDGRIQSLLSFQCASGHCLSGEGPSEELYSGNYLEEPRLKLQTCSILSAAERMCLHTPAKQGVWSACLCLQWWARDAWKELIPPQPLNYGWNVGILNPKANILAPFTASLLYGADHSCKKL